METTEKSMGKGGTKGSSADIVLIYPKTGLDFASTVAPPHAVLAVAAPLHKAGYKIKIIDQRTDPDWRITLGECLQVEPLCVGISTMSGSQIFFALEAARLVRRKTDGRVPIVWGGTHPSLMPRQTLENELVDIVCVGEGEATFAELISALQQKRPLQEVNGIGYKDAGRIALTPPRPLLDIDTLLPVPWELIDVSAYIHPDMYLKDDRTLDIGQTSRGCPFRCGFCASATIRQRRWRPMSIEKSIEAIVEPVRRFRLNGIWIRDDEFYIDQSRAAHICEGIIRAGIKIHWYTSGTRIDIFNKATDDMVRLLKTSGAHVLKFGAESGSNRILKLMQKGITCEDTIKANLKAKRHDITPVFALMMAFPTETFEEIHQTIDLAIRLKKDNPQAQFETLAPYTAHPGTPLFDLAMKMGLKPPETLEGWANWLCDEYDFDGVRLPWYSYRDRVKIGNLAYISVLANALPNAIDGVRNLPLRYLMKFASAPAVHLARVRFRYKRYSIAPELRVIRYLRDKLFYRGYFVMK